LVMELKDTLEAMVEDINELSNRLAAIEIQRLGVAATATINEMVQRDALRLFKKKVPESLKTVVEAARPTTIEEALTVASAAMAGAKENDHTLLWGEKSGRQENGQKYRKQESKEKMNVKCFRCDRKGHFAKDCYARIDSKESKNKGKSDKKSFKKKGHSLLRAVTPALQEVTLKEKKKRRGLNRQKRRKARVVRIFKVVLGSVVDSWRDQ
jgi:Zinc knuckle